MIGIIQKIELTAENPVSVYVDKSSLLGKNEDKVSDDDVVAFIVAFQDVINYAVERSSAAPTYYYYDSMDSTLIYIYIPFQQEQWADISTSEYFVKYQTVKQTLFDSIGWVDCGIRQVEEIPDSALAYDETKTLIIRGREGAEIIWNHSAA